MEGHSECSLEHAWPMIIKQKFAHSGLQSEGKQNQSNHVKSGQKLYFAGKALWWEKNSLPPGTSGQVGILKSPIK